MKNNSRKFIILLLIIVLLIGLFLLAICLVGYPVARGMIDRLSPDGSMESFTADLYLRFRLPAGLIGGGAALLGGFAAAFFNKTEEILLRFFQRCRSFWKHLLSDVKAFWFDLFHPGMAWWEWLILGIVVILAFVGSWIWVKRPMLHDESYTFIAFAKRPFINLISDYHLPNNHVFNSILIHVLYKIFGNPSPVIVRLPSLLAGVTCVPLAFFWARKQYGTFAALTAAGLIAYLPWIKFQSTNGRGYMLMAMFTLIMLILAERVRVKKDRASWTLLILATALNFYTLPIALYPFGIISLWLLISAARRDISEVYGGFWGFFRYLCGYGIFSGILVFLLYSPIFVIGSGWDSFFNNPFVEALSWADFVQTLPIRLSGTISDWQMLVPLWFSIVLGIGIVLSVVFHRHAKAGKTSLLLCALAALTLIFVVQRPNPWSRVWTYLLPMVLVWAATGWFLVGEAVFRDEKRQRLYSGILLAIILVIVLGLSTQFLSQNLAYYRGEKGQEETVVLALKPMVDPEDIVLTSAGYRPAMYYYFDMHGLPVHTIVNPDLESDWQDLYLAVDDRYDENPEDLFLGTSITPETCSSFDLIYSYGHYQVFICQQD